MADETTLAMLMKGKKAWDEWKNAYPADNRDSGTPRYDLSRANLSGANLYRADLSRINLHHANPSGAILDEANLSGAILDYADLFNAKLSQADLSGTHVTNANLIEAYLASANLSSADLAGSDLSRADLQAAKLFKADLFATNFSRAKLADADFSYAAVQHTVFANVDLASVRGVDLINHRGPSTIGIDTLVKSGGKISEVFLRGAGMPESFITNMKSLIQAMDPIQFYSCFISYSTADQNFADRLHADLQAKGVRCWFAPHDIQGGRKVHEQIDEAIRLYDKLLLILSPHSMSSAWVETEIAKARKREVRDKTRVLFPISLVSFDSIRDWEKFDADTAKDSAREIREYFIPDFSQWKDHNSYEKMFARLLKDLRSAAEPIQIA